MSRPALRCAATSASRAGEICAALPDSVAQAELRSQSGRQADGAVAADRCRIDGVTVGQNAEQRNQAAVGKIHALDGLSGFLQKSTAIESGLDQVRDEEGEIGRRQCGEQSIASESLDA